MGPYEDSGTRRCLCVCVHTDSTENSMHIFIKSHQVLIDTGINSVNCVFLCVRERGERENNSGELLLITNRRTAVLIIYASISFFHSCHCQDYFAFQFNFTEKYFFIFQHILILS